VPIDVGTAVGARYGTGLAGFKDAPTEPGPSGQGVLVLEGTGDRGGGYGLEAWLLGGDGGNADFG
jgi:hypothetical protein